MSKFNKASIIIPSTREDALRDCLESLWNQEDQDFEIVVVKEAGPLSAIRNLGAKRAKGDPLIFIDDDVICDPGWFKAIKKTFQDTDCAGVSGPSIITSEFRRNRDLFKIWPAKLLYDLVFCDGKSSLPGHISSWGAWTTGACDESCDYSGEVMFLEACNMAFQRSWFERLGGFDENYKGVGDFSEPDLCLRIRHRDGRLLFNVDAKLNHCPSRSGAFRKRRQDTGNRLHNYLLFSDRWIAPSWKRDTFRRFIKTYYAVAYAK